MLAIQRERPFAGGRGLSADFPGRRCLLVGLARLGPAPRDHGVDQRDPDDGLDALINERVHGLLAGGEGGEGTETRVLDREGQQHQTHYHKGDGPAGHAQSHGAGAPGHAIERPAWR